MESIPLPHYTDEELEYARSYRGVTDPKNIESYGRLLKETLGLKGAALQAELNKPISDILLPGAVGGGSTDFGDVSQIVPSGQIYTACFTLGCPPHSWQACAVGKSPIAHKGELYAAKVLAATALDFLRDPELIQEAKRAFEEEMAEHPYRWVLPDDATPKGYGG